MPLQRRFGRRIQDDSQYHRSGCPEPIGVTQAGGLDANIECRGGVVTTANPFSQRTGQDEGHDCLGMLMPTLFGGTRIGVQSDSDRNAIEGYDALAPCLTAAGLIVRARHGSPIVAQLAFLTTRIPHMNV